MPAIRRWWSIQLLERFKLESLVVHETQNTESQHEPSHRHSCETQPHELGMEHSGQEKLSLAEAWALNEAEEVQLKTK
ncbi:hypothetical protein MHYP_G00332270 [Metynnis hypsauchen]